MKNIIWVGALGLGALYLTREKSIDGPIDTGTETGPIIPGVDESIEDPSTSQTGVMGVMGVMGIEIGVPNYYTWRSLEWSEYFADLLQNNNYQYAVSKVWDDWNNENNPFAAKFPNVESLVLNLVFKSAGSNYEINNIIAISADDTPIYNTWSNWWNNIDYWTCDQWRIWYDKNALKYGAAHASEKFRNAWSNSDNWAWTSQTAGETCGIDCDFVNYFRLKGIDVARFGVETMCNLVSIPTNIIDAASQLSEGAKDTANIASAILPPVLVFGALYVAYKIYK